MNVNYHWADPVFMLLLCLVGRSMLSNVQFVELLINQKYNYPDVKRVLRNCTR